MPRRREAEVGADITSVCEKSASDAFLRAVNKVEAGSEIELADIDSDGWLDLIVVQGESSKMTIYTNQQGTFGSFVDLSVGLLPVTLKSADLDGDGDVDHLVGHKATDSNHTGSDNIYWMENLLEEVNGTTTRQFTVTVNPVNDVPTLDPITDRIIDEDAPEQTVDLTGIAAGGGESQVLSVIASSSNTSLIPNPAVTYASPNTTGTLTFTSGSELSGESTITVTVDYTDSQGAAVSVTSAATATVTN